MPEPPPRCDYLDILTRHTAYDAWPLTLLDTVYKLPAWYVPPDLVDSSAAGLNPGYALRAVAVADLAQMAADARAAGLPLRIVSAYRSYEQQQATFEHWVRVGGYDAALRTSARPGHSEHQLGTTVDIAGAGDADPWTYADWGTTPTGVWVTANAWRYGFVMSYPRDSFALTCYDYEPWHYRYVGREAAARIQASGVTPRYAIWELQ
jgi:D-alanyl-D-alanine carboxypeptidase